MPIARKSLTPELKAQIESGLGNLGPREIWYVCKSTDVIYEYLGNRVDDTHLKTNITDAIAAAGAFDVIKVYPGTYTEGAVLNITQKNLKLIAEGYGRGKGLSETYIQPYGGTYDGITVDASNVEIAGFGFVNAAGKSGIIVANGAGTGGVWIHDCYFYDVAQTGDYHVKIGSTSYNAVGTVVEGCHFFKGKTGVTMNGSRSKEIKRLWGSRISHRNSLETWSTWRCPKWGHLSSSINPWELLSQSKLFQTFTAPYRVKSLKSMTD